MIWNENALVLNLPQVDGGGNPTQPHNWICSFWHFPVTFTFKLDLGDLELWALRPLPLTSFSDNDLDLGDFDLWPWNLTFDLGDLDLWPHCLIIDWKTQFWCLTLSFNTNVPGVKVNLHAKNQGRRSKGLAIRVQTDRRTDGQTHGTDDITSSANTGGKNCMV